MCSSTRGSNGEREKQKQPEEHLASGSQRRRDPSNDGWEDEGLDSSTDGLDGSIGGSDGSLDGLNGSIDDLNGSIDGLDDVELRSAGIPSGSDANGAGDDAVAGGVAATPSDEIVLWAQQPSSEQAFFSAMLAAGSPKTAAALNGFGTVEKSAATTVGNPQYSLMEPAAAAVIAVDGWQATDGLGGATIKTTFSKEKRKQEVDNYEYKRLNESNGLHMVGESRDFDAFKSNCEEDIVDNHFYEGVEKLLEVWFTTSNGECGNSDLRNIPRDDLEKLLDMVHCEIISTRKNCLVDSYVLSESSMFISKRRFILKTCGTTTPLACIPALAKLVLANTNFDTVEDIFYSRKNFLRPELQEEHHRHFDTEVRILDQHFKDGEGYCMGSVKSTDCWFIYTLNPLDRYILKSPEFKEDPDQTIEILMSDLDPKIMSIFYKSNSVDGEDCTKKSGIDKLIPNMRIDDYLFEPCGYSMNGILDNDAKDSGIGEYMTIHITPEKQFSYVSFETNVPSNCYQQLVDRVLTTFRPGRFILTVFSTRTSVAFSYQKELQGVTRFGCWKRNHLQYSNFQSCELTYAQFVKGPS